jgi:hypothetical protein
LYVPLPQGDGGRADLGHKKARAFARAFLKERRLSLRSCG